jgi:hypothetical protein
LAGAHGSDLGWAAPLHRHAREDEYSYVLEGRLDAQLGDEVVYAEVGDLVLKPRDQWHAFWNAGDGPCRILEIISLAGFEHLFDDIAARRGSREDDGERYRGVEVDLPGTQRLIDGTGSSSRSSSNGQSSIPTSRGQSGTRLSRPAPAGCCSAAEYWRRELVDNQPGTPQGSRGSVEADPGLVSQGGDPLGPEHRGELAQHA